MDIRTLRYFLTVAREENMTVAAEVLHVTQPTLSRQMSELEKELGRTLFIRTNRKTLLTNDGIHLQRRAEEILSMVDRTKRELQTTDQNILGELSIGAGETSTMEMICNAASRLRSRYPLIHIHIYSGSAADVTERLDHGLLDFGLLYKPFNKDKYEYIDAPAKDRLGVLVRSDSEYAGKPFFTASELEDMPLIVPFRLATPAGALAETLGISPEKLNIIGTGNLVYNIALMVKSGIANALSIKGLSSVGADDMFRLIPLEPPIYQELIFAWKKHTLNSRASEMFLEEVKQEFSLHK